MLRFFQRILPKPRSTDPELARQESLLYLILLGLGVPGFLFAVLNLVAIRLSGSDGPYQGVIAGFAVQFVYIASFFIARYGRRVHLAAYLPVSIVLIVMMFGDYSLGIGHVTYIGYAMATVAAGILISTEAGILFAVLSMFAHTGIGLLQVSGTLPAALPAEPASTIWLDSIGLVFGLAVIVIVSAIYNHEIWSALSVERRLGDEIRQER
jgi:hypothetical protein